MLYKNKFLLVILILFIINFNFTNAAKKQLTPEQQALKNKMRAERMKKSEAADKLIRHTKASEFEDTVLNDEDNLWIVFYGSRKCPHTQKFNPKWLQFQENMDNGLYNLENVKITKIECYGEQFKFCVSQENQYWPELMFYYKGVKKTVYDGEDEIEDIVKFIKEKKDSLMKEVKSTKTIKPQKSGLPSKKPTKKPVPPKKPTKKPPTKKPPTIPAVKEVKQVKEIESNEIKEIDNNIYEDEIEDNNDVNDVIEEIDNSIDDKNSDDKNDIENGIDENEIDNSGNKNDEKEDPFEQNQGSSHVLMYSFGGCAACVVGFLFAKKRFRGHGYSRIGGSDARTAQMKDKYDKQIGEFI